MLKEIAFIKKIIKVLATLILIKKLYAKFNNKFNYFYNIKSVFLFLISYFLFIIIDFYSSFNISIASCSYLFIFLSVAPSFCLLPFFINISLTL